MINVINKNEKFGERGPFQVESIDAMVADAVVAFIAPAARDIGADPDTDETQEQALERLTEEFRDGLEIVNRRDDLIAALSDHDHGDGCLGIIVDEALKRDPNVTESEIRGICEEAEEDASTQFRAYDTVTEWSGPVRDTVEKAQADADRHNDGCAKQGGYGSAIVVQRLDGGGRLADLEGEPVWPPHGRTNGAARWR